MIASTAVVDKSAVLGEDSHVWNFSVILQNVVIGDSCSIGSHCEVGRGCTIGNHTRLGKGVFLPPNSVVGNHVFIGPGAIFCDDRFPVVNNPNYKAEPPFIDDSASIGAGVVVLPGVKIGAGAMIGAGAVVTRNVPAGVVLRGEPSRIATLGGMRCDVPTVSIFPDTQRRTDAKPSATSLSRRFGHRIGAFCRKFGFLQDAPHPTGPRAG